MLESDEHWQELLKLKSVDVICVCVYIQTVANTNSCSNIVLPGSISYFLTTRSSQMKVEVANDVDPKY